MSTARSDHDAVVIGAGHNGLVAANLLADAGWSVLVLEQQEQVGGAVRSDTDVHPGFVHDTFSAFYPFAAASPVIRDLDLEQHGLRWQHPPAPLGHPFPDGSWALLHPDRHDTAAGLDGEHAGDGEAWLELCRTWDRIGEPLLSALLSPFPPVRGGARLLTRLPRAGGLHLVRELLTPAASFGAHRFGGRDARTLIAGSAGHADIPLDATGSGVFGLIMTMLAQTVGFPVPEGGAGRLTEAMARRLESRGGRIELGTEVSAVEIDRGRAVAVRTRDGERYAAGRAVVADVSAPLLFGRLVASEHLPTRVRRGMASFELDPATVKVDWALSGPIPWAAAPAVAPGSFHVGDSLAEMQRSLADVAAGTVPAHPFMLAGQMTTTDPTRSPAGTESLWAYTHVPQGSARDGVEDGPVRGVWDHDDVERFGDRMQDRIERLAPGFGSRVLSRRVLGPRELQERNASLIGGAVNGGTSQLHQMLVLRPVPGLGRAETGIGGLYLGSSSAHPGGGVHGAPGANAARAAMLHARLRRG
ncbi:Phytoene desaturase (neurosporene-forming) [Nocardioides dokdonensis FR1436]|uniref:Pyridine nucleotide-disulfide oxidoreductase domain-containing protein 2 n=1 Tax=Nocardioides dokdonensis FR1436 TaxID=1300347 RepID=A0A1A9GM53_9ACTN|nr:NAD(P)/FAD-dependent oxidoreductase [Nocardioides dokdonensis]ANH38760.1 Phytoene desaturase (neurosporene-forming) [Nocardioides dokdonensis FR1436]